MQPSHLQAWKASRRLSDWRRNPSFPTPMKHPRRPVFTFLALVLALCASGLRAQRPIGFEEKYALASDRGDVLKELIPGTEDYYFFLALHLQNTGKHADLATLLSQWANRSPDSGLLREIRTREALLT